MNNSEQTPIQLPITLREAGYVLVGIEVDNRCNMACSFCPLPVRESPEASLSLKDVENLLDQLALDPTTDVVSFHMYNEPLIYPHIWECLDLARKRNLRTLIATNGVALHTKNLEKLLFDHPPTMVRISAHVIKEENHKATRGYDGKFSTYINNLSKAMARFVDDDHSIEDIQFDLAIQRKFANWKEKLAYKMGIIDHGDPSIFNETPETLADHLILFLKMVESHSKTFKFNLVQLQKNQKKLSNSASGTFDLAYRLSDKVSIVYKQFSNIRRIEAYHPVRYGSCHTRNLGVLANGDVVLCCVDYESKIKIGNVKTTRFHDILHRARPILKRLRDGGELQFDRCRDCLGAPTRHGAIIRDFRNLLRYKYMKNKSNSFEPDDFKSSLKNAGRED